jgi:hypothetical protein
MGILTYAIRSVRNAGISNILMGGAIALGATLANSSPSPAPESIHATFAQTGSTVSINLTIDTYSTPSDLAILSRAFQDGHDQALVTALSKTRAVGHCSIAGTLGYDIAFIQTAVTPTGRRITFVTNRPLQLGEATSDATSPSFDLAIGQFDINDTDASKSTGFFFPASKLVIDKLGAFHYDLAGTPMSLINVLDSKSPANETLAQIP